MSLVYGANLQSVEVKTVNQQTEIQFKFNAPPKFTHFFLTKPERLIIDFADSKSITNSLPKTIDFNIVKKIRTSKPVKKNALRIAIDLNNKTKASFKVNKNMVTLYLDNPVSLATKYNQNQVLIIAIDPGHGGKDPGTIGVNLRLKEKYVTLEIAKELNKLLNKDPNFKSFLTRTSDYFISVPERSVIARKNNANFLISIHADAAPNKRATGASVWVLSNNRANNELGRWLEETENKSELLGGAGSLLTKNGNDKYLNRTVLDLQFGHTQRSGYELGLEIIKKIGKITKVHKSTPLHASLGVLRSPDIPSVLVETGFLSNRNEEKLLNNSQHRKKIAKAIYDGLVEYRQINSNAFAPIAPTAPEVVAVSSGAKHKVTSKETLSSIARQYETSVAEIMELNDLANHNIFIGQQLVIPLSKNASVVNNSSNANLPHYHTVKKQETLSFISRQYNIPVSTLTTLNKLENHTIYVGQKIKLQ